MDEPIFIPPTHFDGDGFVLRIYRAGDGSALAEAVNASYEHLKPWMPWATMEQTPDEGEATCRRLAANFLSGNDFTLGIWQDDTLLGGTGFHMRCGPMSWKAAEIGMWIRADQAGSGLGSRVLAAMLAWGFGEWGWERLVWKCDTTNYASARVAEKNGLLLEATHRSDAVGVDGTRRDTHLYAILRSEYLHGRN